MTSTHVLFALSFLLHGFTLILVLKLVARFRDQVSINDKFCDTLGLMAEKITGRKIDYEAYARQKPSNLD